MKKWLLVLLPFVVFTTSFISAAEPKVTIICGEDYQFELISPEGTRVFTNVASPDLLTALPRADDLMVVTHTGDSNQYLPSFAQSFPGQKLIAKIGVLEGKGVKVTGIASAFNPLSRFVPEGGTNYIYLIEMGGLRIAHFGSIGQDQLTEEQLGILGKVDIALMQLTNPYCIMNLENQKAFHLMNQIKPKLVIPTHIFSSDSKETKVVLKFTIKKWRGFYIDGLLTIDKADLTASGTKVLFVGYLGKICKGFKLAKRWLRD